METPSNSLCDATRRHFFKQAAGFGIGSMALASLMNDRLLADDRPIAPHFAPKAKRVIYLFMAGGPSQLETFDYKPVLNQRNGEDLPESVRMGQRLTGMSGNQAVLPLAGSIYKFQQHGKAGAWASTSASRALHSKPCCTAACAASSKPMPAFAKAAATACPRWNGQA